MADKLSSLYLLKIDFYMERNGQCSKIISEEEMVSLGKPEVILTN